MNRFLLTLALSAASSFAQNAPAAEVIIKRTFHPKTEDAARNQAIRELVQNLMIHPRTDARHYHVELAWFPALNTIVLTGVADEVDGAEQLLEKYDVTPAIPRKVEFTAFLIRAWNSASVRLTSSGNEWIVVGTGVPFDAKGSPVPATLDSSIAEMKRALSYDRFVLIDTNISHVHLRARYEGLFGGTDTRPEYYSLNYDGVVIATDAKSVNVGKFEFNVKAPIPVRQPTDKDYTTVSISNEISLRDGQKLVIGKIKVHPSDPSDVFLILTAKVE